MQITPEELLVEAGRMALELRLKDQAIDRQAAQIMELSAQLSANDATDGDRSSVVT